MHPAGFTNVHEICRLGGTREAGVAGTAFGPMSQAIDGIIHGLGERDGFSQRGEEVFGGDVGPGVEGIVEGTDDGLFEFCAAASSAVGREGIEVELVGVAISFGQMDGKDFATFGGGGEVDEKDFVESSFPEQFGGQLGDVVGGGDHEYGRVLFGEPGEERAEDTGGGAVVGCAGGLGAGKGLVDFINPEHGGSDRFGDSDGAADVFFGRADEAAEHAAHVEAQERELPQVGDCFGAEAFAATLNTEQEDAFRWWQPERAGFAGESDCAFAQPILEDGHSTEVGECFLAGVVFEQAAFANDLLFLSKNRLDGVAVEALFLDQDFGEYIFGLAQGQAECGLQQVFAVGVIQVDLNLRVWFDLLNDPVEQFG
jgi:hypothetical protein